MKKYCQYCENGGRLPVLVLPERECIVHCTLDSQYHHPRGVCKFFKETTDEEA